MRNQDKGLLTTSSRLLNSQVKRAEMKNIVDKHEMSTSPDRDPMQQSTYPAKTSNKKAISTIDLLRQTK